MTVPDERRGAWAREAESLTRGASGAFLFGIPFLYTMEVWQIGSYGHPMHRLGAVVLTLAVGFLLAFTGGFRSRRPVRPLDAARDSVVATGVGLVCATVVLVVLRRVDGQTPWTEAVGQIVYEMVPCALGVTLSNEYLRGEAMQGEEQAGIAARLGATMIGALVVAFAIAPTAEVTMLSAALRGPWLLGLALLSAVVSYAIVFEAGFGRERRERGFTRPITETLASYAVCLGVSALMLHLFQRLTLDDAWEQWVRAVLVLGFPAAIGGAAGRLAV